MEPHRETLEILPPSLLHYHVENWDLCSKFIMLREEWIIYASLSAAVSALMYKIKKLIVTRNG